MLTSMLEKAIEIEGLLRVIRDGNPLPETYILLNMKAAELAEQAETLESQATAPEPETPLADFVMEMPETPAQTAPEVVFTVAEPTPKEESPARMIETLSDLGEEDNALDQEDLSLIEEDDIILTFEDSTTFDEPAYDEPAEFSMTSMPKTETAISTTQEDTDPMPEQEEEKPESGEEGISMTEEEHTPLTENEPDPEGPTATEESEPIDKAAETKDLPLTKEAEATKRPIKLKSAFSLNDRFLYARELFEGNMKMFDSTLEFIEGIEDYSIIEDYFYSELEWNPEDSNVAAFMDILRPHFRE